MATAPMTPPGPMEDDLMDSMGGEMEEQGEAGYEICIRVEPDGSLSVGVEDDRTPQTEGLEGDEDKSGYQPARDIKEALTMALDIYRQNGKAQDAGAMQAEFKAGYENPKGRV